MKTPFIFRDLLQLKNSREAKKLSLLSGQTKTEKFLLAEIMFNGHERYGKDLDFCLEENRTDLTVRAKQDEKDERPGKKESGKLIEAVEAKMCYTDCLARTLTGLAGKHEYRDSLLKDRRKLKKAFQNEKCGCLTLILFAIHYDQFPPGFKYYKSKKYRRQRDPEKIKAAALTYVEEAITLKIKPQCFEKEEITPKIEPRCIEEFDRKLDSGCRLYVFVFRGVG